MQDSIFFQVGDLTEVETEIFNIKHTSDRPYEYNDSVHLCLSYEMNLDLLKYEREVYTILDWFGNLGGLSEGLKIIFGIWVGILNYSYYNNYMIAQLFQYQDGPQTPNTPKKVSNDDRRKSVMSSALSSNNVTLDPWKINPFVAIFHKLVPGKLQQYLESPKCLCCRKTEQYKVFEDGLDLYEHEIDVVKLLQQLRFMRHFTRNRIDQLPAEKRFELNILMEKSMFRTVVADRDRHAVDSKNLRDDMFGEVQNKAP